MVAFHYDETVIDVFSALREPSVPISAEITRITGITPEMVAGESIDLAAVAQFIGPANLIILHNARFCRPFFKRFTGGFDVLPWACSVPEVDGAGLGFEGSKRGYLVGQCGWFHDGHRTVDDCHALLAVFPSRAFLECGCQEPVTVPASSFVLDGNGCRISRRLRSDCERQGTGSGVTGTRAAAVRCL